MFAPSPLCKQPSDHLAEDRDRAFALALTVAYALEAGDGLGEWAAAREAALELLSLARKYAPGTP